MASCSIAMWIFPDQDQTWHLLHWQANFITEPPGKAKWVRFLTNFTYGWTYNISAVVGKMSVLKIVYVYLKNRNWIHVWSLLHWLYSFFSSRSQRDFHKQDRCISTHLLVRSYYLTVYSLIPPAMSFPLFKQLLEHHLFVGMVVWFGDNSRGHAW